MRATGLVLLLALTVPAAAQDAPVWKRALPGAAAFLGDDGDGDDHVTVCDTPDHWRNTIVDPNYTVAGCLHLPRGLPAIIEAIEFDPMKDADPNSTTGVPMAHIRIPPKGVVGYVRLMLGINPVIPIGTLLKIKRDGDVTNHLAQSKNAELDSGPDLGEQATVKVVRQAPGDDELYVAVMDGPLAGKKGWVATPLEYLVFDKI